MCGIAGVFNLDGSSFSLQHLKKMTDAISHRGPDAEGYYIEENIALGHRRLSILDTSAKGNQPMTSKCGNWVIIFNGCIYNYLELRQELRTLGHVFHSNTDTEVISEGVSAFGVSFFERLDGMFAVGAWSKKDHTLYLSRDRYGVKPLYYWFNKKTIVLRVRLKQF